MGLEGILGAKFAGSFGDFWIVSAEQNIVTSRVLDVLSSCRLSIRACFCLRVSRIFFLEGLSVGVCIPSLGYASPISEDLRLSVEDVMEIGIAGENSCRVSQSTLKMQ